MLTKAYSPEQSAVGKLENQQDVIIIYVKEFEEQVASVNRSGFSSYTYDWFSTENKNAYVLKIEWEDGINIAIRFNQPHFKLLVQMIEPCDLILTTSPISELISSAEQSGMNFLEFTQVLSFNNMQFLDPDRSTVLN
ncbi:MAG TPA: hypothetical protein VFF14_00505 [Candidatus Deferrimicrobium sp.]|nr:hypothetical protein [Candidatus Deferrimicrobium sp.]